MDINKNFLNQILNLRLKHAKNHLSVSDWNEISKELQVENAKEIYFTAIKNYRESNQNQEIFKVHVDVINFDHCLENFSKICRFCLKINENLTEIEENEVIKFLINDNIHPIINQICIDCNDEIKRIQEFKTKCQENFKLLMKVNEATKSKVEAVEDTIELPHDDIKEAMKTKKSNGTICQVCGKLVKGIHMHMLIHQGIKKFQCKFCKKSFTQSGQLQRHVNSHLDIRNYSCPHPGCDKTFVDPSSVSKHLVTHNKDERPFICSLCPSTFNRLGALRYHEKTHRQERTHKCDVCNKTFLAKYDLTKHFRVHTGEKPYGCKYCPKRFSISKNAKVHQRVHTREKPFTCIHCNISFSYQSSLKKHVLKFHENKE